MLKSIQRSESVVPSDTEEVGDNGASTSKTPETSSAATGYSDSDIFLVGQNEADQPSTEYAPQASDRGVLTPLEMRIAVAANLMGAANGIATEAEIAALRDRITRFPSEDMNSPLHPASEREAAWRSLLSAAKQGAIEILDLGFDEFRDFPREMREMALAIDGLWGDADGRIEPRELDRLARYFLWTMPAFADDAAAFALLAEHLGHESDYTEELELSLRLYAGSNRPSVARELLAEAISHADVVGQPELYRSAEQHAQTYHSLSILEHTALAAYAMSELLNATGVEWEDGLDTVLLHDVGKLVRRRVVESDMGSRYAFWEHESIGSDWLESQGADERIVFHVREHSSLRNMPVPAVLERLAEQTGAPEDSPEVKALLREQILLYVADQIGKGTRPKQLESFQAQLPKLRTLAEIADLDFDAVLETREKALHEAFPQAGGKDVSV